ncbi:MAG: Sialic acid synthase [Candidatus Gottesmanbacteria bacterium GW2011_GWA1_34_13]|uniref:Sialic acid synthase n=1 Tax=Candidatus Gottesmanbacteria bacterium GW2011_GWA1_34_13 TaxID=1618434 RepID=A0A0G0DXV4_9BACT|nr:MAG: Sialic acid synthase [Candidatus Gottesmanbacteria bacterium GW2011_GWA1_34_13]
MNNINFKIGKKTIGENSPCFIVAEMSGNHNQDIDQAYKIVDEAAKSGVDAIKLQTYTPKTLTINSNKKWFKITSGKWKGTTLYTLYQKTYTPWEWQPKLKSYAEKKGLICFSTPFDNSAVDFLEKMNVSLYKIASFENIDLELLKRIGKTKKPVIISRGLASLEDIKLAIKTLKTAGSKNIAVLHCISSYPATLNQMNIRTMQDIQHKFKVITGLSDHSLGLTASITAVAMGAKIIEKHITLSRKDDGYDSTFSLEPKEMKQLVITIRDVEKAMGKITYKPDKQESENIIFKRSLFAVKDIKKGERITYKNIKCIRPGYGISPVYLDQIIGKAAKQNIEKGSPLSWKMIQE